ncbi:MAG: TonB-dependent receptor, partial [Phocaeicola sp.]|nr:TonB-dependent receptor [Phocaeicola sp.]
WHVSNENFMQPVKHVLSDLKLRASYGVNGNQPGSLYGYMGLYSYGQSYIGNSGSYESSMPNPKLGWEKNYNLNVGIDLGFFNRLFVSLEYYNRDTKDLLYSLPISGTTGFTSYLSNVGQLNNKGVELEVRSINFATNDFDWTTVFNLSHNRNKIVSLNGQLEQSIEGSWFIHKVGLPYYTYYVKEYAGVDRRTGQAQYYLNTLRSDGTLDRSLTTDASEAQTIPYKSVNPKISGGLTNLLRYKNLDLSFTLTYSLGGYSFDKTGTYIENGTTNIYSSKYNLPIYAMDRWQESGDQTDVPRFVYGEAAGPTNSSRYIHSTDHLRLKNLTIGYTLPVQWTSRALIEKARIYFSGSNLLTWAKWDQYDPETPVNGEVFCEAPAMRTFNFGVQLTF